MSLLPIYGCNNYSNRLNHHKVKLPRFPFVESSVKEENHSQNQQLWVNVYFQRHTWNEHSVYFVAAKTSSKSAAYSTNMPPHMTTPDVAENDVRSRLDDVIMTSPPSNDVQGRQWTRCGSVNFFDITQRFIAHRIAMSFFISSKS